MKKIILIIGILLFSKAIFSQNIRDKKLLKMIYCNEKNVIDSQKHNYGNYISILNFSKNERFKVYNKNRIDLKSHKEFLILEASSANGDYYGFLIIKDSAYYYRYLPYENEKWIINFISLDNYNQNKPDVNDLVLSLIKDWKINEILERKSKLGYSIFGGYSFIASKVNYCKSKKIEIETIIFEEFIE